jgi:hypothetical protein
LLVVGVVPAHVLFDHRLEHRDHLAIHIVEDARQDDEAEQEPAPAFGEAGRLRR